MPTKIDVATFLNEWIAREKVVKVNSRVEVETRYNKEGQTEMRTEANIPQK